MKVSVILILTYNVTKIRCLFGLSSIHDAVRHGNVLELQGMVQRGAGINDPDAKFQFTPLHWAAHHGSLEVCDKKFAFMESLKH